MDLPSICRSIKTNKVSAKTVTKSNKQRLGLTSLVLMTLIGFSHLAHAVGFEFNPSNVSLAVGETTIVQVVATDIPSPGLAAYEFKLGFTPTVINIVNPNINALDISLIPFSPVADALCGFIRDPARCPDPSWFLTSTGRAPQGDNSGIDNGEGTLRVAQASGGAAPLPVGSGVIALIEVSGVGDGTTTIEFLPGENFLADDTPVSYEGVTFGSLSVTVGVVSPEVRVGGTVNGLRGNGLVLQNNGGDDLPISAADGAFVFPATLASGSAYDVTILSHPSEQTCSVTNGSGIASFDVSDILISCIDILPPTFSVGGNVSGLAGSVTLQNNGGDDLTVSANGSFNFATAVVFGGTYSVTVASQPIGQSCTVVNNSGTVSADVTNVVVTCATNTHSIGGSVSGLSGSMTLQNNGGDDLIIDADGSFSFATAVAFGGAYNVTVASQPTGQSCTVVNNSGTVSADVTDVAVTCATNTHSIGGSVSGLSGSMTLQNNGGDDLIVDADSSFSFATAVAFGGAYNVTVASQPSGQSCTVANSSGTVNADVTNVAIICATNTHSIGGSVSGLSGSMTLQNNGGDDLIVDADGSFSFTTAVAFGGAYSVTVVSQPSGQSCTVANSSGTVNADVTNVAVTCATNTHSIGGSVSGLSGSMTLQNNGGDDLIIDADGSFTFTAVVAFGGAYNVTVASQPTGQSCTVANNSGTVSADVTDVAVTCATNTHSIGGSVSGLSGSMTLQNNGGDDLIIDADGSFSFVTAVAFGGAYSVTVVSQPSGQSCTVANSSGTVNADVTDVAVTCATNTHSIGGSVSGLSGSMTLQNNGDLIVDADGSFSFATAVAFGGAYSVTVVSQPTGQTCTVANGNGTANADVTEVVVVCATDTFTVGGTVSGLTGSVTLQNNGGDDLIVNTNGNFTFATSIAFGSTYEVTITSQPNGQECSVGNGIGIVDADVTTVVVQCNSAPVADAGANQNVFTGDSVKLDGTASFDPDNDPITFEWSFVGMPASSALIDSDIVNRTSPMANFTPDVDGTYELLLVVTDDKTLSGETTVLITATTQNVPPNAATGGDQSVETGSFVTLNGSGSNDPDNGPLPLTYNWSFDSVPAGSALSNADMVDGTMQIAGFAPDVDGEYVVRLDVFDGADSATASATITASTINVPPTAKAGSDQTAAAGDTVVLDGSASNDPDSAPEAITFTWTFASQPSGSALTDADISGANTATPSFVPDAPGAYLLRLDVFDGADGDFDQVMIEAGAPPSAPINLEGRAKLLHVNVVWDLSAGAASYIVFRKLDSEVDFVEVGTTETAVYVDDLPTGTTSAEYFVQAENVFGVSDDSVIITVLPSTRSR